MAPVLARFRSAAVAGQRQPGTRIADAICSNYLFCRETVSVARRLQKLGIPMAQEREILPMDRRLTNDEVDWLRKVRDARTNHQPSPALPLDVARKLSTLGCLVLTAGGRYMITLRGRDELVDRELEKAIS